MRAIAPRESSTEDPSVRSIPGSIHHSAATPI